MFKFHAISCMSSKNFAILIQRCATRYFFRCTKSLQKRDIKRGASRIWARSQERYLQNTDFYKYTHTEILEHDPCEWFMDNKIIIPMTELQPYHKVYYSHKDLGVETDNCLFSWVNELATSVLNWKKSKCIIMMRLSIQIKGKNSICHSGFYQDMENDNVRFILIESRKYLYWSHFQLMSNWFQSHINNLTINKILTAFFTSATCVQVFLEICVGVKYWFKINVCHKSFIPMFPCVTDYKPNPLMKTFQWL